MGKILMEKTYNSSLEKSIGILCYNFFTAVRNVTHSNADLKSYVVNSLKNICEPAVNI